MALRNEKQKRNGDNGSYELEYKRNSPITHIVRSHWHGYWIGKGKKQFTYKWVLEYKKGEGKLDVVLHDCIEVEKQNYTHGEQLLYRNLDILGIEAYPQYRVSSINKIYDCLVKVNGKECFIEFDGEQHFRKVKNWDFDKTKESDILKNNYCRDNKIPLLRIKYNQISKMYDILEDFKNNVDYYLTHYNTYLSDDEYYDFYKNAFIEKWRLK